MKKRVLALLLAAVLLINSVPMAVFAEDAPASVDVSPAETPIIPNTEPEAGSGVVVMSEDAPETEPFIMLAAEELEPQPEPCGTCGVVGCEKQHIKCIACSNYDCTVKHEYCNTCEKYDCGVDHTRLPLTSTGPNEDYSGDVGKFAVMNPDIDSIIVNIFVFADDAIGKNTTEYLHEDFESDTVMRIDDWYCDANGNLWYLVTFAKGNVTGSFASSWPEKAWVKQADDEGDALTFVKFCEICKTINCSKTHVWCEICEKYDCGVNHNPTPPATGCGCCEDCTGDEGCDCSCPACDFYEEPETTDEVSETIIGANGTRLSFAVTGEGIPADARLEVTDESGLIDADIDGVGIYNIKVRANGDYWQPTPGETVSVSLPVSGDVDEVTIVHLLEDPAIIAYALNRGIAQAADLSMAAEENGFQVFAAAVDAYQEATGSSDICAAVEIFEDVPVVDGEATVDANGFSVFVSCPPNEIELGSDDFFELDSTVYVRPGEWVRFTNTGLLSGIELTGNGIAEELSGEESEFSWLGTTDAYVHVDTSASKGSFFTVRASSLWPPRWKTVRFEVVDYFDYGNVYIGVIGPNEDYPNEVAPQQSATVEYYYNGSSLNAGKAVYCMYPDAMIDIDAVYDSNLKETNNSKTVYGVADTTGSNVRPFLRDTINDPDNNKGDLQTFAELEAEILNAYAARTAGFNPANYRVVPYVVKHETIGNNVGWYINCKIELKSTYILSYDYNEPAGFNAIDHIGDVKKPQNQSVSTEGAVNGIVTAEVDCDNLMVLTREETVGNKKNTYTATFIGWSTSNTDQTVEYAYNAKNQTIEMDGNTTLYAVWKLSDNIEYVEASLLITKIVKDSAGNPVDAPDVAFTFTPDSRLQNLAYSIYNEKGMQTKSGTLGSSFELKNGWTIIIENVPNNNTAYTISETIPAEHSAGFQTPSVLSVLINATTNKTGYISKTFDNTIKTYTVTWKNADGAVLEQDTNVPYGATPSYDGATPAKADDDKYSYTFKAWTPALTEVSGNAEYTAVFDQTAKTFTITYDLDGGTVTGNPDSYTAEDKDIVLKNPTKPGYTFDGWTGTGLSDATEKVTIKKGSTGDRSYTANWTPIEYRITYQLNGGTVDGTNQETYTIETRSFKLENPTRIGYTFAGWTGTDLNEATTEVTVKKGSIGNRSYTANWTPITYWITYDTGNGGTLNAGQANPEAYAIESDVQVATMNVNAGYSFEGWKATDIDGNWVADRIYSGTLSRMYGDVTLTAQWSVKVGGSITDNNDGTPEDGTIGNENGDSETNDFEMPDIPLGGGAGREMTFTPKKGYEIIGVTVNGKQEETISETKPAKEYTYMIGENGVEGPLDVKVTTRAITYTITYDLTGGALKQDETNPETYTIETETFTLKEPVRGGYDFMGWTGSNGENAQTNLSIAQGTVENLSYTAVWQVSKIVLTIQTNSADANQTYLFDVSGTSVDGTTKVELTVVLGGNDEQKIVDLPAGTYTVSDRQAWSWRYDHQSQEGIDCSNGEDRTQLFTYASVAEGKNLWLNGYSNLNGNTKKRKWLW